MKIEKVWKGLGILALMAIIAMAIFLLKFKLEYWGLISGLVCLSLLIILDSAAIGYWIKERKRRT